MRNLILAVSATAMAIPATFALPTDSAQAQRRYYRDGYYDGPTWRDRQGRYRCRRANGTTGLIIGAAGGALIGRELDGRAATARPVRFSAPPPARWSAARSSAATAAAAAKPQPA